MRCTATRVNGSPCHALAMRGDPDQRCGFHSRRGGFAVLRASAFTKEEAIQTVGREIRALKKAKGANPVEKAEALKDLVLLWQALTTPEPEPSVKSLTWAERVAKLEKEKKEK